MNPLAAAEIASRLDEMIRYMRAKCPDILISWYDFDAAFRRRHLTRTRLIAEPALDGA